MNEHWLSDYVSEVRVSYRDDAHVLYCSTCSSLDVNDHVEEVHRYVKANGLPIGKSIELRYLGKRMFIGDGPCLSRRSIALIADLDAELTQDNYCNCLKA